MAAKMVSSAVAQEAVNQVISRVKEVEKQSDAKEKIERMEMAHIKLEAALEISKKWNINSAPLLRWQSKLKRATQECGQTLRRCRQRLEEEEELKEGVRSSSFPKRLVHIGRSLVLSMFSGSNDDELRRRSTAVGRFERFADGATEFLSYVELGGTPCRYMFSGPLIRHLLAVKGTKYCFVRDGQRLSLLLQPFSPPNHGMEGSLMFLHEDGNAPENTFLFILNLRLCEFTDIVGVVVRCLQLFIPYLSSTVETVKTKLTQVPMQDLCWVSGANSDFCCDEQQINLHAICSKWYRPNLFCCQQQNDHCPQSSSSESLPCDMYMEPVIRVYLLGHVALPDGNSRHRAVTDGESQTSLRIGFPYLKLGAHFWPHVSYDNLSPGISGSASEMMNGEAKQHAMYANISFEQLGEVAIRKAVDCLGRNIAATSYQTLWKSKHGSAYLRIEKTPRRATTRKGRVGKRLKQRQDKKLPVQGWTSMYHEFISSWIMHMPSQVQGSVVKYWIQKGKQSIVPSFLKTDAGVHDCPIVLLSSQDHGYLASKFKMSSTFNA